MAETFFDDFADAVHRLRRAFLRHGLTPPTAIELGDMEAGKRLQLALPEEMVRAGYGLNQRDKPDPDVIIHFMGVEIRYPAELRARPGGRIDFDDGVAGRSFYSLDGKRIR